MPIRHNIISGTVIESHPTEEKNKTQTCNNNININKINNTGKTNHTIGRAF